MIRQAHHEWLNLVPVKNFIPNNFCFATLSYCELVYQAVITIFVFCYRTQSANSLSCLLMSSKLTIVLSPLASASIAAS
jgi:hypothetical protein